jgi:pimeloyl-ACP methyl ester carboxylesterase
MIPEGTRMTELIKIGSWKGPRRGSVVFVHGLGGHAYDTWRRKSDAESFWPVWLVQDIEGLTAYCLSYSAPASNWVGTAMPLEDRAVNILECLLSEPDLTEAPIGIICHSLGGLVIKQVLRDANEQKDRRPDVAKLLDSVREVIFIATPHTGSSKATWLDRLRFLAWPSTAAKSLVANDPGLRSLNVSYRELADERREKLRHRIFYEMQKTAAGMIVDEGSGDAGLPDTRPVPIDADHISICKPLDRGALLYSRIRSSISELAPRPRKNSAFQIYPIKEIRAERSISFVPVAIRIVALSLAGIFLAGGVYTIYVKTGSVNQTVQISGNQNSATQIAISPTRSSTDAAPLTPDILDGKNNQVVREVIK